MKLYGPYNENDWEQMLKLRKNLKWYRKYGLMEGHDKENALLLKIIANTPLLSS
jgi:hypothetical protein